MNTINGDERCLLDAADRCRRPEQIRSPIHPMFAFGRTFLLCAIPSGILVGWVTNRWPASAPPVVLAWWVVSFWPAHRARQRAKQRLAQPGRAASRSLAFASAGLSDQGSPWYGASGVWRKLSLDVLRALPGIVVVSLLEPQLRVGICFLVPAWCVFTIGQAFAASRRAEQERELCYGNQAQRSPAGTQAVPSGQIDVGSGEAEARPTLMHGPVGPG